MKRVTTYKGKKQPYVYYKEGENGRQNSFIRIFDQSLIAGAKVDGNTGTVEYEDEDANGEKTMHSLTFHRAVAWGAVADKLYGMLEKGAKQIKVLAMDIRDNGFTGEQGYIAQIELKILNAAGSTIGTKKVKKVVPSAT